MNQTPFQELYMHLATNGLKLSGFNTQILLFVNQKHSHMQGESLSIQTQLKTFPTKLGAIYARLNLFCRPMQVFNVDESGVNIITTQRESDG